MRKLTGYIGAMIIVFALMGSILAGYALNINGTNTVMNEYERVTDVSGLYSHTQEPSYIDYNPASNYIGYSMNIPGSVYTNASGNHGYKVITDGTITIRKSDNHLIINGNDTGIPPYPVDYFICDNFYIDLGQNGPHVWAKWGDVYPTTDIIITVTNNFVVITYDNTQTYLSNSINLVSWAGSDWDYWIGIGRAGGNSSQYGVFINDINQIVSIGLTTSGVLNITVGNSVTDVGPNNNAYTVALLDGGTYHAPGVNYQNINYSVVANNTTYQPYFIFWPRTVTGDITQELGINYSESNRVNNYLINTEPANTIKTSTKIDLMSISAADQWDTQGNILVSTTIANHSTPPYPIWSFLTPNYTNQYGDGNAAVKNDIVIYKLSDVLSTYTIPNGTQTVKIDFNSTDTRPYTFYGNTWYLDGNVAFFQKLTEPHNYYENKNIANEKLYGVYDLSTNLVSVYQPNGTLEYTETPDNIGVLFVKPNQIYGRFQYHESVNGNFYTEPYTMANRQNPFVTMTSSVYNPANNHYMDITKGVSIKSTNGYNTIWNNEYSNSKIQILFRAETTPGTYHNTLTIGDNVISVDYNTNKYLVTLNGNDPVDIGTWRNIVLNVDLINGELSAIPVRTFNSYTNVELDNTNIIIGNLVNAAPTNTIEWASTTDSLTFNVYSTSVFMNTYGVVMVDPTLNITDYFTTLDNFYQLRLSNFSMYGQTMTINGVTGTVTGNTISFNDETIQIKDMAITYADGNVTISDSYATIDLGAITDNNISMTGAWYFISELYDGYTTQKTVYDWDWGAFILDDKSFGVIYIGLCLIGLIVARKFCNLTITDYLIFIVSIAIALTVPVIA